MGSAAKWLLVVAVLSFGCSSSDDGDKSGGKDGGNSPGSGGDDEPGSGSGGDGDVTTGTPEDTEPVGDDLTLLFTPMYSAYDGGKHKFTLPAIVQGGLEGIKWSARPADGVDFEPDSDSGGVRITTRKSGDILIIARAGKLSGSSMLHVTDTTPELWELGEHRYNNEIPFPDFMLPDAGPDGGMAMIDPMGLDIPDNLSCHNCHSATATALDVEHTPQQTGGYSDEDLIKIFTMGMKPANAKFHTPFPETLYMRFHTWEATDDEKLGLITYLRSLTPKSQGALDFQGLRDQFM
jgi:hypothetical protein